MQRGEVWWVRFDELRPGVLLSGDEASGFETIQIVSPVGVDISDWGVDVPIGTGRPHEGVVRLAFPNPDFRFCTWLTTLTADLLVERAGLLDPTELRDVDEAVRLTARQS